MLRKTFLSILSATVLFAGTVQAQTVLTSGGVGVLQDAIDAATAGDTIILDTNGVFTGDLVITKTLTIEAAPGKTPSIINDGSTAPGPGIGAFATSGSYYGVLFSEDADGSRLGSTSGGLIQLYLDADAGGTADPSTGNARPHAVLGFDLPAGAEITVENVFSTLTGERRGGKLDNFQNSAFARTALIELANASDLTINLTEVIFDGNGFTDLPYRNPFVNAADEGWRKTAGIRTLDSTATLNLTRTRIFDTNWGNINLQKGNYELNVVDSEIGDERGIHYFAIGNAFISSGNVSTNTVTIDGSVVWGGLLGAIQMNGTGAGSDPTPHDVTINDSLIIGNLNGRAHPLAHSTSGPVAGMGTARGAVNINRAPSVYTIDHSDIVDITDAGTTSSISAGGINAGDPINAAAIEIQTETLPATATRTVEVTNSNLISFNWPDVLAGTARTTPGADNISVGWNNAWSGSTTGTQISDSWVAPTTATLIGDPTISEDPQYADLMAIDAATANANLHGTGESGSDIGSNNTFTGSVPVELGSFELF